MDTREERRQHFLREQQTKKRLRLATTRLPEAEHERIWAIVAAYDAGLSIRQIATATGLSRSRIHQLLQDDEAREIPTWLIHLRDRAHPSEGEADTESSSSRTVVQARVAEEVEVLRWCLDWLAQLERGEIMVVNLRPDSENGVFAQPLETVHQGDRISSGVISTWSNSSMISCILMVVGPLLSSSRP